MPLPLLADADAVLSATQAAAAATAAASTSAWTLVAQLVVGGATTIAAGYFAMRTNGDKATLTAQVRENTAAIKLCEEDRAAKGREITELRGWLGDLAGKLAGVKETVRGVTSRESERHPGETPSHDGSGPLPTLRPG